MNGEIKLDLAGIGAEMIKGIANNMKYYFANLKWIEATCQIRLKTEALNSWDKLRVEQVVLCVHILFNFYNSFHWMN